jgi:GNAT superfamily N-acetyltransferase
MPRHLTFDLEKPWRWYLHAPEIISTPVGRANLAPSGYLWGVEVYEEWRGRGLGRELVRLMIAAAKQQGHCFVRLRVHATNDVALGLYIGLGFSPTGLEGTDSVGPWIELELEFESDE